MIKDTNKTTFYISLGLKNNSHDVENYFYEELNTINHPDNNDI